MRTKLTVTSINNGTLKLKKERNMLRTITAGLMLFAFSFIGMSFTTDDTARTNDTAIETKASNNDGCCTVTTVNGTQTIVITTTKGFAGTVKINGMDVPEWLNSLMAYNYGQINMSVVHMADTKMDAAFIKAEKLNKQLAVAFGKNAGAAAETADVEMNTLFDKIIAAPLYKSMMKNEVERADAKMDEALNDDAELLKMAVLFTKTINTNTADAEMDILINVSNIRKTSVSAISEADNAMDKMMNKTNFKTISPAAAVEADQKMDQLLKEKQ
jgi:hypothetical protein